MSMEENKLTISDENGNPVDIYVLDIIDRKKGLFRKVSYIIFIYADEPDQIYASILNEKARSYSLDTITDPDDLAFINREIDRVAKGLDD